MINSNSSTLRSGAVLLAVLTISACASRPKPMGPSATSGPPPMASREAPPPPPSSGDEDRSISSAPVPGSARDFVINAGDIVYFDFDRYEVRAEARHTLDSQVAWLTRYPAVHVRIEGNCDERGTREYNFALGARRAEAVKEYLTSRGIPASRIDTVSYGKEHPVDTASGDEADAHNRNARTVVDSGAR